MPIGAIHVVGGNPHSGIPGRSAREMDSRRRRIPGDVARVLLQVGPHFQDAVFRPAGRRDLQGFDQAGLVGIEVAAGFGRGGPAAEIVERGLAR